MWKHWLVKLLGFLYSWLKLFLPDWVFSFFVVRSSWTTTPNSIFNVCFSVYGIAVIRKQRVTQQIFESAESLHTHLVAAPTISPVVFLIYIINQNKWDSIMTFIATVYWFYSFSNIPNLNFELWSSAESAERGSACNRKLSRLESCMRSHQHMANCFQELG